MARMAIAAMAISIFTPSAGRALAEGMGIFVMRTDGSQQRKVAQVDGFGWHSSPRFSHDGRRLLFEVGDGPNGSQKVFVVNVDGSGLAELGEHGGADWSPDDRQIVYHHFGGPNVKPGIWVMDANGGNRQWLLDGSWPRWSTVGDKIAFNYRTTIRVLDLVNNEDRLLVDQQLAQNPTAFDWSRDGKQLAFFSRSVAAGPRQLFIASAERLNKDLKPRFSREGMVGGHVSWSADDKQLLFAIESYIHVMDVDGSAPPRRVAGQTEKSRDPVWSADGQWIAFARRPG